MIETKTLMPSGYDSTKSSYSSITSSYPITNAYTDTSSTTYAQVQCTNGSRVASYISLTFDVSGIPDMATITSVTCKAKASVSSTTYLQNATIQIYRNTSTIDSAVNFRATSATTRTISTNTSWTRSTLDDLTLRFTATRTNKNTTTACYMRIYGAELTITYEYEDTKYTITVTSNGDGVVSPSGSTEASEGENFELNIYANNGSNVTVLDNNVNVTENIIQTSSGLMASSVIKDSYTEGDSDLISGTYYTYANGQGSDTSNAYTNNDYCNQSDNEAYIYYRFNSFDSIPSDAIITNVTCKVKGHAESSTAIARCQLRAGGTAKGSAVSFTSRSNEIITLSSNNISRSELDDLLLEFAIGYYGGLVLGATVTVEYQALGGSSSYIYTITNITTDHNIIVTFISNIEHSDIYLKINGSYVEASAVYKKQNNVWVKLTKDQTQSLINFKFIQGN